ncbi:MAG: nucleoside-diphosphate sugar epimerase/dehydratase [Spirochaetia bacterium]|jgi:FlaA1/EpsC-like NDP-sugar epimerase|nr:nucleoside-diphosphate sugar epimerase/dehydratase [Spirochaetia bacterium]
MSKTNKIIIIGAGFAGREIAAEILSKGILGEVVAFLDDSPIKIGKSEHGIQILGPIINAAEIIKEVSADEALIAIPGAEESDLRRIYGSIQKAELKKIRILPNVSQIIEGDAHLIQTREIKAQDLLARKTVHIGLIESLEYLRGKRVLITGAGGSIGSELARQLLSGGADRLYLFDHGENNVYEIERELRILQDGGVGEASTIVPIVGELQDRDFVKFIIKRLKADVIFHCAAYKHVPLIEENPVEAVKNNIFGTKNIVDAAIESDVSRFVFISTDKAVYPASIYGASKMVAEEIVLNTNSESTNFMVVRFGNVLGSRGSIVPLFTRQIMKGGPVSITHKEVKRFFMTIPEAASLVLKTGGVGSKGDLYILEMGEPILIRDLAEQMIRFYGFIPEKEIKINYIGLRPGEKMDEQLWTEEDTVIKTKHPGIIKVLHRTRLNGQLNNLLGNLKSVCYLEEDENLYRNRIYLREILKKYIPSIQMVENEPEY